jgi:hypothetical protein
MASPAEEVNRVVRTVIEAADPALRPVAKLRRFVVKRVELVGARPTGPGVRRPGTTASTRPGGGERTGAANFGK